MAGPRSESLRVVLTTLPSAEAAETLARLRGLYDTKAFPWWCVDLVAEPTESLAPLGHARSGSRPGSTTSFSSALADIVVMVEQSQTLPPAGGDRR